MWWSTEDLNDWLRVAATMQSKYARHGVDPRFKTRVLSNRSAPVKDADVLALPPALLHETLRDMGRRAGPHAAVVMREFPFAHAPDLAVLVDPGLQPHEFMAVHHRACVAVATSMALLKTRLDKREDREGVSKRTARGKRGERGEGESSQGGGDAADSKGNKGDKGDKGGKRSGVILQGVAGSRFVEVPFLFHAPTVQLVMSRTYVTHHQLGFMRGTDELASFDLFRLRAVGDGAADKHGLDVVIYHQHDQELHRLYPQLRAQTAATDAYPVRRWTDEHLVREAGAALARPDAPTSGGYMAYKWERMGRHLRG